MDVDDDDDDDARVFFSNDENEIEIISLSC